MRGGDCRGRGHTITDGYSAAARDCGLPVRSDVQPCRGLGLRLVAPLEVFYRPTVWPRLRRCSRGGTRMKVYLDPTEFLDFEDSGVRTLADEAAGQGGSQREQIVRLYYLVRDRFRYDPYRIDLTRAGMKASTVVARGYGFCITKAALFAAGARALKVPSRLGFADVRNHLATARLLALLGTNVFYYHGYAEVELDGRWVKATPAFNLSLCERFRVRPLEFDGRTDSIFHAYDADDCRHMEYLTDRGWRADLPFEEIRTALLTHYPAMQWIDGAHPKGDFAAEATAEAQGVRT